LSLAEKKAEKLLKRHLSWFQRLEYRKGYICEQGKQTGLWYRLELDNCRVFVGEDVNTFHGYGCLAVIYTKLMPYADYLLTRLLLLRADETLFRKTARIIEREQ